MRTSNHAWFASRGIGNFVGNGALTPVLPYTVIETLGLSATTMTLLLASFAFAMFLSNPLLGRLSDHVGRRPVLIFSLMVNVLAHIWFALSTDIVQMFGARFHFGFGACIASLLLVVTMVLKRRPAMQPQYRQP